MTAMPDAAAFFRALFEKRYGGAVAAVRPPSSAPGASKHSFLYTLVDGQRRVLHTYRAAWGEVVAPQEPLARHIAGVAALLRHLDAAGYPAPRPIPARDGAATVLADAWSVLVTDYLPGEPADYALPTLAGLGAVLARLHRLAPPPSAVNSWRSPTAVVPTTLARLRAAAPPRAWRAWHADCQAALAAAIGLPVLPECLIHADAWTGNALRAPDGRVVLIDWECAGLGPAILDLGALILHAHYDRAELPPEQLPETTRIAALTDGYQRHRRLAAAELAALSLAIGFGPAFRSALFFYRAAQRGWDEAMERHLRRERDRFASGEALARAALAHLRTDAPPA